MKTLKREFPPQSWIDRVTGKIRRTLRDRVRKDIRSRVFRRMEPYACASKVDCEMAYLLCRKDFEMGLIAAWSLLHFSSRKIRLRFFEDGSLLPDDWSQLKAWFPGHEFYPRPEIDRLVEEHFGADSNICRARSQNPLFHKLVDIPFLSRNGRANYSDPDILYFSDPTDLLDAACSKEPVSWFNRDMESSYFYPAETLNGMLGRAIPERINAGMYSVSLSNLDFDKLEQYLGEPPFSNFWKSWRVEQTLFAVLTSENGAKVNWLPESYDVEYYKDVRTSPCKHYVGWIRHGFETEGLAWMLETGKI